VTSRTPNVIDEHYYRNAFEMEYDATHYDSYSRTARRSSSANGPHAKASQLRTLTRRWATLPGCPEWNATQISSWCPATPAFRQRESRWHAVEKRPDRLRCP